MSRCSCQTTRRGFLVGCSAAIAGLAGSRFNSLAFGAPAAPDADEHETLVVLFLRGGQDGLNLVVPTGGADRARYEAARPTLRVPVAQAEPYALGSLAGANGAVSFGLHPAAAPLHPLYQDGRLAVVVGCGMAANERSHFDSMNWMELGTPGLSSTGTGWVTRHLDSAPGLPAQILMPSLSLGGLQAMSQLGSYETIAMASASDFALNTGPWSARADQRRALRNLLESDPGWVHASSLAALDAADLIELYAAGDYVPSPGVVYPEGGFAENLRTVAQMIKLDLGLRVATLDLGGWDHHENEDDVFATLVDELARGVAAFWEDLAGGLVDRTSRLTVVVMSEFGRRVGENEARGTDHGHGNNLLVLSGSAIGGLHGAWPGLHPDQLADGDLAVTTDFRRPLAEIVAKRLGNPNLHLVFPGYAPGPWLEIVSGTAPPSTAIFGDDFEDGDLEPWTVG